MKAKIILISGMLLFAFSAAIGQVTFDYDKEVDFSQFKTIRFVGWQNDSGDQINELDKERIYDAFKKVFAEKGFELVKEGGDLALTFYLVIDQKTSTTAYTDYHGGMGYGRYSRAGWGWGYGSSTTNYSENDYLEGTFVVDFYSFKTEKLIWQGVSTSTVKENPKKRAKREKRKSGHS